MIYHLQSDFQVRCASTYNPQVQAVHSDRLGRARLPKNHTASGIDRLNLPPLSLYIHFPWCLSKCPYCDFNSHHAPKDLPEEAYLRALFADFESELPQIGERPLISIYCGGGTPSLFSSQSIAKLLTFIQGRCQFAPDIEITLEVNPEAADIERLSGYLAAGVNRLSIGVQSFQDEALKRLGRVHLRESAIQAISAAVTSGFSNFNIDLMHGLPGQEIEEGLQDLNQAINLTPPHLSWYQLTIEPHTEFARQPPLLPQDEKIWELQDQGMIQLSQAGFIQYEISALSQPSFECRHNLNYWSFGDYIGIGAGAHGKLSHIDHQFISRTWKLKHPKAWLQAQNCFLSGYEVLSQDHLPFEFMLNALRCYQTIDAHLFEKRTGLPFASLEPILEQAALKGLVTWTAQSMTPTMLGRRFYNDLVALFLK